MANRLAALEALFDSGQKERVADASVDQSVTTYPAPDLASFGLDSSTSINVLARPEDAHMSLTDGGSSTHSLDDASPQTPEAVEPVLPNSSQSDTGESMSNETPGERFTQETPRRRTKETPSKSHIEGTPGKHTKPQLHADYSLSHTSSSLSTSLRASQLGQSHGALELLDDDESDATGANQSSSGHWGVQEMRRRTAAGISIKSTQQRIEQLTAERDDLKIEVDFHRRNMSPEDVGAEVISLRQEKLGYVRRLQKMNELVKSQDQALKTVNRQLKAWEARIADVDDLEARLREAEQRAASSEGGDASMLAHLEASLRTAQSERQALQDELDALRMHEAPDLHEAIEHRDTIIRGLRAELADVQDELEREHERAMRPSTAGSESMEHLQQQLDEQHETICALQDALAAERLNVAEKDGEMDRLETQIEAAEAAVADAQRELGMRRAAEDAAVADAQHAHSRAAHLARELEDVRAHHESRLSAVHDKMAAANAQVDEFRERAAQQAEEREQLVSLNERLNAKLVELVQDLKDEEDARAHADTTWSQRYDSNEAQTRRAVATKDALIESLEAQVAQLKSEKRQQEQAAARLREALAASEAASAQKMQEAAKRHEREMERLADDVGEKLRAWQDAQDEVTRLRAEVRDMATTLQSETRSKLRTQDKLEAAQRALDDARADAERRPTPSPRLTPRGDAQAKAQLAERNALLASVYEALARALQESGSDARLVHTDYHTFYERLQQRLKRLTHVQAQFAQRTSAMEKEHLSQLADVRRLQETRWTQLERIERAIRAASEKQAQWRKRVLDKEHELAEMQRTNRDLEHQVARYRDAPPPAPTHTTPAMLSVRIRELERRCKEADERVKRERAGAKERASRDEARIRYVYLQLTPDICKRRLIGSRPCRPHRRGAPSLKKAASALATSRYPDDITSGLCKEGWVERTTNVEHVSAHVDWLHAR